MTRAVNRLPSRRAKILLGAMPFLIAVAAYWVASDARQAMDAGDKLMPGLEAFRAAMSRLMFDIDRMTGQRLFWADTAASLARLGVGLQGYAQGVVAYENAQRGLTLATELP